MFFKPDLIVYVWLIPAFIFFFFPVLFLPVFLMQKKSAAQVRHAGKNDELYQGYSSPEPGDKRAYPRQQYDNIFAHVSDGTNCCRVSVNNISKSGINFACPPDKLNKDADKLGVLLTGSGKTFPMQVKPQWKNVQGTEESIGATIVTTPPDLWEEFAGSIESRSFMSNAQQAAQ